MRIVHIASGDFFSTYGGGQVYVKNVVDEMIAQGFDVAVISSVAGNKGIEKRLYKEHPLLEITSPAMLEEAIKTLSPDVIHAHSIKAKACAVGRKLNIPVVVTSHHGGILCPAGTRLDCTDAICRRTVAHTPCLPCVLRNTRTGLRWWYPVVKHLSQKQYIRLGHWLSHKPFVPFITPIGIAALQIERHLQNWKNITRNCSVMIAPCNEIADAMILNGLSKDKVTVLPHGIPLPAKRPDYPAITDGKIKFFYVGRICYVKGIHTLLEAFSLVSNPAIELHLIGGAGNKTEQAYMQQLQKRHANDSRIIWHGKIAPEEVFKATANYHVSSSSAFLEAFGLNIAEALALGKPVLATRSGGGEMQILDGVNGWLVEPNNVAELSKKIEEIASHPDKLSAMSKNCNAISITDHCQALYSTYCQILNN